MSSGCAAIARHSAAAAERCAGSFVGAVRSSGDCFNEGSRSASSSIGSSFNLALDFSGVVALEIVVVSFFPALSGAGSAATPAGISTRAAGWLAVAGFLASFAASACAFLSARCTRRASRAMACTDFSELKESLCGLAAGARICAGSDGRVAPPPAADSDNKSVKITYRFSIFCTQPVRK